MEAWRERQPKYEYLHLKKLSPFGYGKEVLRARYKVYLEDAAIAPAVLMKGKTAFDDPSDLGIATEAAVFKHIHARYYAQSQANQN